MDLAWGPCPINAIFSSDFARDSRAGSPSSLLDVCCKKKYCKKIIIRLPGIIKAGKYLGTMTTCNNICSHWNFTNLPFFALFSIKRDGNFFLSRIWLQFSFSIKKRKNVENFMKIINNFFSSSTNY